MWLPDSSWRARDPSQMVNVGAERDREADRFIQTSSHLHLLTLCRKDMIGIGVWLVARAGRACRSSKSTLQKHALTHAIMFKTGLAEQTVRVKIDEAASFSIEIGCP